MHTLPETWRAAVADEDLRRAFSAPAFDDRGWEMVAVPGHWQTVPAFSETNGPVLYRVPFPSFRLEPVQRAWLTFEGIFYDGDVWLDGSYVGATEGYFFPHTFEVTDALAARDEHVLAVEVGCSPPADPTAKRALTGVFQHWDCFDPAFNPGGIWRPVHLSTTGPVRIHRLRVLCAEATAERAVLDVRAELDSATAGPVSITAACGAASVTADQSLAHGPNRIRMHLPIENPPLWWPHALGDQPLVEVTLSVSVPPVAADDVGGVSDVRSLRTGIRQVRMKNWIFTVNGERLFLKGTNQGPPVMALGAAPAAVVERDVVLARQAGLDLLRVHAHISRPELYDAADRHGMLLWQDMPLQWGYARGVRKQAARQAVEAVDLLGHHPSIAVWCGHNEPMALAGTNEPSPAVVAKVVASQELPTWNKTILDTAIGRALTRADPTRPVVRHSGVWPTPVTAGTDTHVYFGWYHGGERDLPRLLSTLPRMARFVTEFGAQAVPHSSDFIDGSAWPDLDWASLEARHALQKAPFDRYVPPGAYPTFEAWRDATQEYQATLIRHHIETLRRLKYRPTGGFCQFSFADAFPAVTWSVLDHLRVPKAGYHALAAACAPVIVVAARPLDVYPPGAQAAFDIHVVSDLRRPLRDLRVVASMGAHRHGWTGSVEADSCTRIGTFRTTMPVVPGPLSLELSLTGDGVSAAASYATRVGVVPASRGR